GLRFKADPPRPNTCGCNYSTACHFEEPKRRKISMQHHFVLLLERFMEILRSFLAQNDMT
ncbi:MAG: hypothetical protein R3264_04270, partial [Anaerolineae bacterium]|nr:hypothetical protein [Anaerolineae bacterium]